MKPAPDPNPGSPSKDAETGSREIEPVVLHTSAVKKAGCGLALLAVGTLLLATATHGLTATTRDRAASWFLLLVSAGMLTLGILDLRAARPGASYLLLDEKGFTVHLLGHDTLTEWASVEGFVIVRRNHIDSGVGWQWVESDPRHAGVLSEGMLRMGHPHASLHDNYGLSYRELAALLETWRVQCTRPQDGSARKPGSK